jgi:hypothetical protein
MRLPAFLRHVFPPPGAVEADRDGQQGMCVLPWLAFDGEISFGDVTIAGWSRVQGALEPEVRTTAAQILAGFRDVRGNAVEPSLCWFSERGPTSPLSEDDVEILRKLRKSSRGLWRRKPVRRRFSSPERSSNSSRLRDSRGKSGRQAKTRPTAPLLAALRWAKWNRDLALARDLLDAG